MLHLRVICPPEATPEVLARLRGCPGTAHLVLNRGVALEPTGDLVEADVARESADELLEALGELGIDHSGGITLEPLDTVLSDAADTAQREAPGDPADAIVWEELIARTGDDSRPTVTFFAFLTLACLIAVVGIVTNSPVTVVGAMAVGPEFGPLAALAIGLVLRRRDLVRQASLALGLGFPLAILATAAGVLVCEATGLISVTALDTADQVDFIYQVGPFSLIVALLAGAAGMLSLTSAKSAALVGVFISVTTVPAAAFAVVAATTGDWARAGESLLQLGLNLVGIVVAAAGVLMLRTRRSAGLRRLPVGG
ncbi:DUF389 domain-containing protein [Desertihabitans aurantiacus]|uniref:DUF389 domain-containing protein n=1 Tax=Desertihabitans aurantiacus TaxID=2282477 RepID=UPI000DF7FDE0|nr:DUF389 domain-containing protein [Desertihabitans aurantiacus]